MIELLEKPETCDLPSVDCYWNPGEQTTREHLKLMMLHQAAGFGGLVGRVVGRLARESVGILTYHRIARTCPGVPAPTINVTPETFRRQLTELKNAGFHFASLSSVLDACQRPELANALPERTVVVTFDDIYDNVFQNAWPVLSELEIPATFFISTAFIDSDEPFLFDPWARQYRDQILPESWKPITDAHLRSMLDTGDAELGAHTHTHQDFRGRAKEFAADVECGLQELQQRYGRQPLPFAFPYGSPRMGFCSEPLMDAVKQLGLRCGLTTGSHANGIDSSAFGWGRFHVFEHDTPHSLAAKLDGWYEWLPKMKNLLGGALR